MDMIIGASMVITPFVAWFSAFANAYPKHIVIQTLWHTLMPTDFGLRSYVGSLVDEAPTFCATALILTGIWAIFSLWNTKFRVYSYNFVMFFVLALLISLTIADVAEKAPNFLPWFRTAAKAGFIGYSVITVIGGLLILGKYRRGAK